MSKKKEEAKAKGKGTKKSATGKTVADKKKSSGVGKTATGNKSGSGRTSQSAKRTPKKEEPPKKTVAKKTTTGKNRYTEKTAQPTKRTPKRQNVSQEGNQSKEQKVLIYGVVADGEVQDSVFPKKFPFWARLKIDKKRTTLVIDEEKEVYNKRKKRYEEGFVHREAIHPHGDGSNVKGYEKIEPNPDPTDKDEMYLKNPAKLPKRLFKPHNKELAMPEHLKERYDKNNHKNDE